MKRFNLKIDGDRFDVTIESLNSNNAVVSVNGKPFNVTIEPEEKRQTEETSVLSVQDTPVRANVSGHSYKVKSPLPGQVLNIKVKEGQSVKEGQVVAVIEAMKMENDIEAECSGIVKSIKVEKGDSVLEGTTLLVIE